MKICGKCGHRNFKVTMKKKKRICESCGDKMDTPPDCQPYTGGGDDFEINGGGCYRTRPKPLN